MPFINQGTTREKERIELKATQRHQALGPHWQFLFQVGSTRDLEEVTILERRRAMKSKQEQIKLLDDPAAQLLKRAVRAKEIYSNLLRERGLKAVSWDEFPAWKEYVQGQISDPELNEKAKMEMNNLELTFGKHLVTHEEGSSSVLKDPVKRARAKLANKIYQEICRDQQVEVCFFTNFSSWSDYVRGVIGESEFYRRAEEELEHMVTR
jgi:hypothetical protein